MNLMYANVLENIVSILVFMEVALDLIHIFID